MVRQERGWKLMMLLPRLLLHRPPGGGKIPKRKLVERFEKFSRGEWTDMFLESAVCDEKAAVSRRRSRRRRTDDLELRATRAECWCSWANSPRLDKHWRDGVGPWSSEHVAPADGREPQTTSAKGPHSTRTLAPCSLDRIQVGHRQTQS